ncbi:MAG: hypothetical protein ACI814_003643 [Mariniblastus sp.]|jgi:hypothetical protein
MNQLQPDSANKSLLENTIEMLLRHLQIVVRGFVIVDHVLRRRHPSSLSIDQSRSESSSFLAAVGSSSRIQDAPGSPRRQSHLSLRKVTAIVLVFGPIYGAAMGSYAFVAGKRSLIEQIPQMIYSGVKVPLLVGLAVAISLPSFFVISTLLGLRDDFRESLRAIVSAQAGLAVILASLFPMTVFAYLSTSTMAASYSFAILFNAAMFGVASVSAQVLLRGYYVELVKRSRRHLWMARVWILVYAFVGIQAGYVLRPFIGSPDAPTTFFRRDSFQNAYVKIFELIWAVLKEVG